MRVTSAHRWKKCFSVWEPGSFPKNCLPNLRLYLATVSYWGGYCFSDNILITSFLYHTQQVLNTNSFTHFWGGGGVGVEIFPQRSMVLKLKLSNNWSISFWLLKLVLPFSKKRGGPKKRYGPLVDIFYFWPISFDTDIKQWFKIFLYLSVIFYANSLFLNWLKLSLRYK